MNTSDAAWKLADELVEPIKAHLVRHLVFGCTTRDSRSQTARELHGLERKAAERGEKALARGFDRPGTRHP